MSLIAIVDDDRASRVALAALLQEYEHRVVVYASCDDLINALIGGRRYHAIILDMWMPLAAGHGTRCYQRILDVSPAQAERIVFATGGGLPLQMEVFLEGRTWVEKPIVWRELEAALDALPKVKP